MNSIAREHLGILHATRAMRQQVMEVLTDQDLAYTLPGANVSLGTICREIGQVQQAYTESFKSFTLDYQYKPAEAGIEGSVERLKAWYAALDQTMDAVLSGLDEADIQSKVIDRGGGFTLPVVLQVQVFREALLIFAAKAVVYLNALNKPLSQQLKDWIG